MNRRTICIESNVPVTGIVQWWLMMVRNSLLLTITSAPDAIRRFARPLLRRMTPVRIEIAACLVIALTAPWIAVQQERGRANRVEGLYSSLAASSAGETSMLKRSVTHLLEEQADLRGRLVEAGYPVVSDEQFLIRLVATGYSSSVWETDDTPFVTASNTHTRPGVVAMSRDLLRRYNPTAPFSFGDTIHVSGLGEFVVEDSMHGRWKRRMDVWFPSRRMARRFGRRDVVVSKHIGTTGAPSTDTSLAGIRTGF